MKKIFLGCLVLLLASVWLIAKIEHDPGYVLLSYSVHTVETSIWIALVAFVALFLSLWLLFIWMRRLIIRSSALSQWFSDRGYRKSQKQTTQGLIAFIEGNWQSSRRILSRAAEKSETPLLNYLIAARACHELGDAKQINEFLKKAEQSTAGAGIAVELTQAELQLRNLHFEQALATLTRLRRNASKHPHVLHLLKSAYIGLNDWQAILDLLPDLRKYKVAPEPALHELELTASKARIDDISKGRDNTLSDLNNFWSTLPKAMARNSEFVACYAEHIIPVGGEQQAEKLIRNQLKREWNKDLISLYGTVASEDAGKQLLHAEAWLLERNNDSILMLTLGRLSLRNGLWGKAKEYFENSLKMEKTGEVCAELGRLLAHLGEHERSNEYFHQGLLLNTSVLPQLPMPEKKSA
jgi:HemY protein